METQAGKKLLCVGKKKQWKKPCMTSNHLKKTMQHQEMEFIIVIVVSPGSESGHYCACVVTLTVSGGDPHAETNVTSLGLNQFVIRV